jgi:hypothetical protein
MAVTYEAPNSPRILGDKINDLAEELSESFKLSKCEAMSMVAQVLLDETIKKKLDLSREEVEVVESFVMASCLNDNEYLFQR